MGIATVLYKQSNRSVRSTIVGVCTLLPASVSFQAALNLHRPKPPSCSSAQWEQVPTYGITSQCTLYGLLWQRGLACSSVACTRCVSPLCRLHNELALVPGTSFGHKSQAHLLSYVSNVLQWVGYDQDIQVSLFPQFDCDSKSFHSSVLASALDMHPVNTSLIFLPLLRASDGRKLWTLGLFIVVVHQGQRCNAQALTS